MQTFYANLIGEDGTEFTVSQCLKNRSSFEDWLNDMYPEASVERIYSERQRRADEQARYLRLSEEMDNDW